MGIHCGPRVLEADNYSGMDVVVVVGDMNSDTDNLDIEEKLY